MAVKSLGVLAVGMFVIGGCAGQQHVAELRRLKADVGLLDQRVSQLERASLQAPSAAEWPSGSSAQPSATEAVSPAIPTQSAPAAPVPPIKPSKKEIQQALKAAGFYQGPVDGKIGPQTQEAIRQFQQVNGLKVDGVVGRRTWEKLAPYLDLSSSSGEVGAAEVLK
jgi:murein L,D-transpeptidase YcbB/YkuD